MTAHRRTNLSLAGRYAVFIAAAFVGNASYAATAAKSKPALDKSLAQAMDSNPNIVAMKARLAMAEAELRNARFEVARQLVGCWNEIKAQEPAVALAEEQVKFVEEGYKMGRVPYTDLNAAKSSAYRRQGQVSRVPAATCNSSPAKSRRRYPALPRRVASQQFSRRRCKFPAGRWSKRFAGPSTPQHSLCSSISL